jgi:hypothetical protein
MSDEDRAAAANASRSAVEFASAVACFIDMMALFASPRVAAKLDRLPAREVVLDHIDAYLKFLRRVGPHERDRAGVDDRKSMLDTEPDVLRLKELFVFWTPLSGLTPEITRAARELLHGIGLPAPDEGWDNFEGPPPDPPQEPEDPDPRPPPTEAELSARPDMARYHQAYMWCRYLASPRMVAKISPAALRHPALEHIDTLLASYRPVRSDKAKGRAFWVDVIRRVESLRVLCEAWDGSETPPPRVQEAARAVILRFEPELTRERLESLDEDVQRFYLESPRSTAQKS